MVSKERNVNTVVASRLILLCCTKTNYSYIQLHEGWIQRIVYCNSVYYIYVFVFLLCSLDCTGYQWIGIGDDGATALSDLRVITNFTKLK